MTGVSTEDPPTTGDKAADLTRPWYRRVPTAVIAAVLVLVLAFAGLLIYAAVINHAVGSNLVQSEKLPPPGQARPAGSGAVNYVIVGSDKKGTESGAGRSDALMVLHLNADRQGASLISFPADMKVPIPGHGTNKINSAYALGGGPLVVTTLEDLLGVRMSHVAVIDLPGFVELTDQLGGVTVDNPTASKVGGYDFPKGRIDLRGDKALAYVSQLDNLQGGDSSRTARQRLVMRAMVGKVASKDMLLNPAKFTKFMESAAKQVSVDRDLSTSQLGETGRSLGFDPGHLLSIQAPGKDAVSAQLGELKTALKNDTVAAYAARYPKG
jgi:LCP family protein required for cell wall assembly